MVGRQRYSPAEISLVRSLVRHLPRLSSYRHQRVDLEELDPDKPLTVPEDSDEEIADALLHPLARHYTARAVSLYLLRDCHACKPTPELPPAWQMRSLVNESGVHLVSWLPAGAYSPTCHFSELFDDTSKSASKLIDALEHLDEAGWYILHPLPLQGTLICGLDPQPFPIPFYRREDYTEAVQSNVHTIEVLLTPRAPQRPYSRLGLHDRCVEYISCLADGQDMCETFQQDGVCNVFSPHFTADAKASQQTVLVASSCYVLADIHTLASAARTALAARRELGSSLESSPNAANVTIATIIRDAAWMDSRRTRWMESLDLLALRVAEYADGAHTMSEIAEAIVGALHVRDSLVAPGTTKLDVFAAAQRLLAAASCLDVIFPSVTKAGKLQQGPAVLTELVAAGRVIAPTPMRAAAAAVVAQLLSHAGFDTDQHAIRFARHPRIVLSVDGTECLGMQHNADINAFYLPEHDPIVQGQHSLELTPECINVIRAKRDALLELHGYGVGVRGFDLTEFANKHVGAAAVGYMPHRPKTKIA